MKPTATLPILALLALLALAPARAQVPSILNYQGRVTVGGTNLTTNAAQFKFALVGPGTNTSRTATASGIVNSGFLTSIAVTDGGSGYTNAPSVNITDATGSGAVAAATISSGVVTGFRIESPGSGYSAAPVVTIAAPPANLSYPGYWNNAGGVSSSEPSTSVPVAIAEGLYSVLLGDTTQSNMAALPSTIFSNSNVNLRVWFSRGGTNPFVQLTPDQRLGAAGYALRAATTDSVAVVPTIAIGTVSTGAPGSSATVSNVGTSSNAVFSFTIPRGANGTNGLNGTNGAQGLPGLNGTNGLAATIAISNVATGAPGSPAIVTNVGTATTAILSFTIPQGLPGSNGLNGANGAPGPQGPQGPQGPSSPGNGGAGMGTNNIATGDFSFVGGGAANTASNNYAAVAGGVSNMAVGSGSFVGGGSNSRAIGLYATVGGGNSNAATGDFWPTVAGGSGNTAGSFATTVGGGSGNTAYYSYSTVAGGGFNTASGESATVGGGFINTASNMYATVGGGYSNAARSQSAFVGGGRRNTASGESATLGGGSDNTASGPFATVGGGYSNAATSNATVGGGSGNAASGQSATVGGGSWNRATTSSATVAGGNINEATAAHAAVGGGYDNTASGDSAVVGGGYRNTNSGFSAVVGGGYRNTASAFYATVPGGQYCSAAHEGSFVWSGDGTPTSSFGDYTFTVRAIGGAKFLTTTNSTTGPILSGSATDWAANSDSNLKTAVTAVDTRNILAKLSRLPITAWQYKHNPSRRYIGPMAQDFRAAFGLGSDDRTISTLDSDGVMYAAIQGLVEELRDRDKTIEELKARSMEQGARTRAEVDELKAKLQAVEQRLNSLPPAP
jgi:hypothetical protein